MQLKGYLWQLMWRVMTRSNGRSSGWACGVVLKGHGFKSCVYH